MKWPAIGFRLVRFSLAVEFGRIEAEFTTSMLALEQTRRVLLKNYILTKMLNAVCSIVTIGLFVEATDFHPHA
jgi:hypothetical protein